MYKLQEHYLSAGEAICENWPALVRTRKRTSGTINSFISSESPFNPNLLGLAGYAGCCPEKAAGE